MEKQHPRATNHKQSIMPRIIEHNKCKVGKLAMLVISLSIILMLAWQRIFKIIALNIQSYPAIERIYRLWEVVRQEDLSIIIIAQCCQSLQPVTTNQVHNTLLQGREVPFSEKVLLAVLWTSHLRVLSQPNGHPMKDSINVNFAPGRLASSKENITAVLVECLCAVHVPQIKTTCSGTRTWE